jgi:hypothetical protein
MLRTFINTLRLSLVGVLVSFGLGMTTVNAASPTTFAALGSSKNAVCSGAGLTSCSGGTDVNKVITGVINVLSAIIGVAAVIMIIISGLRYITSGGEGQKVASAKGTLIYALVGLVIVALAQVIVHFVLQKTK